jgi:hypothetical protein
MPRRSIRSRATPSTSLWSSATIYTAIYGFMTSSRSDKSRRYVEHVFDMIPPYWEAPELLVDFNEEAPKRP